MCSHDNPVLFRGISCVECLASERHFVESGSCIVCGPEAPIRRNQLCSVKQNFSVSASRTGLGPIGLRDLYLESRGSCGVCNVVESKTLTLYIDHAHVCCSEYPLCGSCTRGLLCPVHNLVVGIIETHGVDMYPVTMYLDRARTSRAT